MRNSSSTTGKVFAIVGASLFVFGFFLQLVIVSGLYQAFATPHAHGISHSTDFFPAFEKIQRMLIAAHYGYICDGISLILIVIALNSLRYRAEWFFWFTIICGLLMVFSPFCVIGLFLLIFCILKRREFLPQQQAAVR